MRTCRWWTVLLALSVVLNHSSVFVWCCHDSAHASSTHLTLSDAYLTHKPQLQAPATHDLHEHGCCHHDHQTGDLQPTDTVASHDHQCGDSHPLGDTSDAITQLNSLQPIATVPTVVLALAWSFVPPQQLPCVLATKPFSPQQIGLRTTILVI